MCRSIGRAAEDFVELTRTRESGASESLRTIHPKKNLVLRLPQVQTGTFVHSTPDPSIFYTLDVEIFIDVCECITAAGCPSYISDSTNCQLAVRQLPYDTFLYT